MQLVFTAQSKRDFYCRDAVCEYVLRQDAVPINPFRLFGYFLNERIEREFVRRANSALINHSDELWAFGQRMADGVLDEVLLALGLAKPVRFFTISADIDGIREVSWESLRFEPEVYRGGTTKATVLQRIRAGIKDGSAHRL